MIRSHGSPRPERCAAGRPFAAPDAPATDSVSSSSSSSGHELCTACGRAAPSSAPISGWAQSLYLTGVWYTNPNNTLTTLASRHKRGARLLPGQHAVHGGGLLQHSAVLFLVKLERGRQVLAALLVRAVVHHLRRTGVQLPSAHGSRTCSHPFMGHWELDVVRGRHAADAD